MRTAKPARPFLTGTVAALAAFVWCGCAFAAAAREGQPAGEEVDITAMLERAADHEACDDYEGARKVLVEAYAAAKEDVRVTTALAVVELKSGAARDALGHFEEARKKGAEAAEMLLWSAVAQAAAGNNRKSAELLSAGLEAAGKDEAALYDLAEKFLRSGAMSVSALLYGRINEVYPAESQFDIFSYLHLAAYHGLSGREAEAAEILRKARRPIEYSDIEIMLPQECDYLTGYFDGLALVRKGDVDGGVNLLKDTAVKFPDGVVADAEAVRALDAAGRTGQADGTYAIVLGRLENAVKAAPESASAYFQLAALAAVSKREPAKGLSSCEWALRIAPLRPECLETKAELLSQLGRDEEALVTIQRAMVLVSAPRWVEPFGYDSFAWLRLDILAKLGRGLPSAFRELPAPRAAR